MINFIVELCVKQETLKIIKEMVKTTPNDADLGSLIRRFVNVLESKEQP